MSAAQPLHTVQETTHPCPTSGASRSQLTRAKAMVANKTERLSLLWGAGDSWTMEACQKDELTGGGGGGTPSKHVSRRTSLPSTLSRECDELVLQRSDSMDRSC